MSFNPVKAAAVRALNIYTQYCLISESKSAYEGLQAKNLKSGLDY